MMRLLFIFTAAAILVGIDAQFGEEVGAVLVGVGLAETGYEAYRGYQKDGWEGVLASGLQGGAEDIVGRFVPEYGVGLTAYHAGQDLVDAGVQIYDGYN